MLLVQMIDRLMYLIKLTKYSAVGFFFFPQSSSENREERGEEKCKHQDFLSNLLLRRV